MTRSLDVVAHPDRLVDYADRELDATQSRAIEAHLAEGQIEPSAAQLPPRPEPEVEPAPRQTTKGRKP